MSEQEVVLFIHDEKKRLVLNGQDVYIPTDIDHHQIRVVPQKGHVAVLVGNRISVYDCIENARSEETDAIARYYDDQGKELS